MKRDEPSSQEHIRRRAQRMQQQRRRTGFSPLQGLGAFGVVGWSVALPTVGGALLGMWLDRVAPRAFSWPIALMLGGLVIGVLVAWEWVAREQRAEQDRADELSSPAPRTRATPGEAAGPAGAQQSAMSDTPMPDRSTPTPADTQERPDD